MLWILLALLGAITNASYFIIIKRHIMDAGSKDPDRVWIYLRWAPIICLFRNPGISGHWSGFLLSGCHYCSPEYYQPLPDL